MSQAKFLAGVAKVIADSIRRFASDRGDVPFHMQELTDHVMSEHRVAPDSPDVSFVCCAGMAPWTTPSSTAPSHCINSHDPPPHR
jgi:hypothetical protein